MVPTRKKTKPSLLDDYKGKIEEKVLEGYTAASIYRFIKRRGYQGKYTILRDYVKSIKVEGQVKATMRFGTNPGLQVLKIKRMQKITRFRGAIPSLAVVKEGALQGFVLVNLRYPGFNYDNYLFASKYLDEQGISKKRKAILKKSDVSDFDLEGYEKEDSRLFQNRYAPTISFKDNKLYFNKTAVERLTCCKCKESF